MSVESIEEHIAALLVTIQADMFEAAKRGRDDKIATVTAWADFVPALEKGCMVLTPFCDQAEWEDKVKVRASAITTLHFTSRVMLSLVLM